MRKNLGASVRARLLKHARAQETEFGLVLTRFALERLLYRLGSSRHREQFLLKGALLFDLWFDLPHRPTRDADFLKFGAHDAPALEAIFREICAIDVADGIVFDPHSVRAQQIRNQADYGGIRVTLIGSLDGARCPVQADVGFGDVVTPAPEQADYPVLLDDLPQPSLLVYPRATVIAEKFEAIVSLGIANSRMKDFFDLWVLSRDAGFDVAIARHALAATFERRGTALPATTPVGLSTEFGSDPLKQTQWRAFLERNGLEARPLGEVVEHLCGVLATLQRGA